MALLKILSFVACLLCAGNFQVQAQSASAAAANYTAEEKFMKGVIDFLYGHPYQARWDFDYQTDVKGKDGAAVLKDLEDEKKNIAVNFTYVTLNMKMLPDEDQPNLANEIIGQLHVDGFGYNFNFDCEHNPFILKKNGDIDINTGMRECLTTKIFERMGFQKPVVKMDMDPVSNFTLTVVVEGAFAPQFSGELIQLTPKMLREAGNSTDGGGLDLTYLNTFSIPFKAYRWSHIPPQIERATDPPYIYLTPSGALNTASASSLLVMILCALGLQAHL